MLNFRAAIVAVLSPSTLATVLILIASATSANAQTVVNGDFSDLTGLTGGPQVFTASPASSLPGWTYTPITGPDIIEVFSYSMPITVNSPAQVLSSDDFFLEGSGAPGLTGTLSQVIDGFDVGQQYCLDFEWGQRQQFSERIYDFEVNIGNGSFSATTPASQVGSGVEVGMNAETIFFIPSSSSETLSIDFLSGSGTGAAVDSFSLRICTIPEPSSGVLLGIGLLGLLRRRKR